MSTEAGFQKHAEDLVLNPKQSDLLKEELTASEKSLADAALDLGVDPGGTEGSETCFSLCPNPSTAMRIQPRLGQVSPDTREHLRLRGQLSSRCERQAIPLPYTTPEMAQQRPAPGVRGRHRC